MGHAAASRDPVCGWAHRAPPGRGAPAADGPDLRPAVRRAARTALAAGAYLTLTSQAAAEAAKLLGARAVVPLHFEGWAHFTQGRDSLSAAFEDAGLADRLHLPEPGDPKELTA